MNKSIYASLVSRSAVHQKSLAMLIDPGESIDQGKIMKMIGHANDAQVDLILVGGSFVTYPDMAKTVHLIKTNTHIPVLIFPGNSLQVCEEADGILFLSLISGRNPEYLIGQHVPVAVTLRQSGIEVIPTGYILIDGGINTSAAYMSATSPIPANKTEIVNATALAGELLGLKLIYLEAGSGAKFPVRPEIIAKVRENISAPLIVGGGINSTDKAFKSLDAGADMIVIGNHLESQPEFIHEVSEMMQDYNRKLNIHQ